MARTLTQIDRDLDIERAIWIMERRAGDHCDEAEASREKLDVLLDERSAVCGGQASATCRSRGLSG